MLIIFILSPRLTEQLLSGMSVLAIADGKITMENPELAFKFLLRREVTHVIPICMSFVKTSHSHN